MVDVILVRMLPRRTKLCKASFSIIAKSKGFTACLVRIGMDRSKSASIQSGLYLVVVTSSGDHNMWWAKMTGIRAVKNAGCERDNATSYTLYNQVSRNHHACAVVGGSRRRVRERSLRSLSGGYVAWRSGRVLAPTCLTGEATSPSEVDLRHPEVTGMHVRLPHWAELWQHGMNSHLIGYTVSMETSQ